MWKAIFLLFLISLTLSQSTPKCSVCVKVKQCPKDLYSDTLIDPIFNYLVKQVSIKTYPNAIKK